MSSEFLAGSTGFVGSNLAASHSFTAYFNSRSISEAYGLRPDILVYAGVRSEMFTANKFPEDDRNHILCAMENISRINPGRLVLISTISVYPDSRGADEDTEIMPGLLTPYGRNRRELEEWAENNIRRCLIVRLPALFGINMKKNFLYDFIHVIPMMLTEAKFLELSESAQELGEYYQRQENGFYRCRNLTHDETSFLKDKFRSLNFTALNFTDSRSAYQFYPLKYLWHHIETALSRNLSRLNIAVPPVSAGEVYRYLTGREFRNELDKSPYSYDMRTKHYELFGGSGGYLMSREQEMREIRDFVRGCGE